MKYVDGKLLLTDRQSYILGESHNYPVPYRQGARLAKLAIAASSDAIQADVTRFFGNYDMTQDVEDGFALFDQRPSATGQLADIRVITEFVTSVLSDINALPTTASSIHG